MGYWNALTRKQRRDEMKIPAWVPIGVDDPDFRLLFTEDDARTPDGESGSQAWKRIFEEDLPAMTTAKEKWDGGDCDAYLFPGNRVYESSFDGCTIWQYLPPRKFD